MVSKKKNNGWSPLEILKIFFRKFFYCGKNILLKKNDIILKNKAF